jgi:hypothetical protein
MSRPRFRLEAAAAAAVAVFVAVGGSAAAETHFADLRVVTHTGRTLAEFRQYTGPVAVRSTKQSKDCFGQRSSEKRYRLDGASDLGLVKDALASDPDMRPLVLSDAFVDDGFGLGVCSIGGFTTVGFRYWDLITNHQTSSTGASLTPVRNGDDVLWYFTSGSEPSSGPRELLLRAPASARPNDPFTVKALRFSGQGKSSPAGGVGVYAASRRLGTTNADGELRVRLTTSAALDATGTPNDIPSNHVAVCVSASPSKCPDAHGKRIYGSNHADRIKGTSGWDRIDARGGADLVDLRTGGRDRVNCGGGRDQVVLRGGDRNDQIGSSCERVSRR